MITTEEDGRVHLDVSVQEASVLTFALFNLYGIYSEGKKKLAQNYPTLTPMPDSYAALLGDLSQDLYQPISGNDDYQGEWVRAQRQGAEELGPALSA